MNDSLCLCHLLKNAAAAIERELSDALSDLDVSHCQASVLTNLLHGPMTMSAVSKELCCHKSNVTQVVDGLAKKKLVERIASKEDRRVSRLKLTEKGRMMAEKAETLLAHSATICTECFTPTERSTLITLLEKSIESHR